MTQKGQFDFGGWYVCWELPPLENSPTGKRHWRPVQNRPSASDVVRDRRS